MYNGFSAAAVELSKLDEAGRRATLCEVAVQPENGVLLAKEEVLQNEKEITHSRTPSFNFKTRPTGYGEMGLAKSAMPASRRKVT